MGGQGRLVVVRRYSAVQREFVSCGAGGDQMDGRSDSLGRGVVYQRVGLHCLDRLVRRSLSMMMTARRRRFAALVEAASGAFAGY